MDFDGEGKDGRDFDDRRLMNPGSHYVKGESYYGVHSGKIGSIVLMYCDSCHKSPLLIQKQEMGNKLLMSHWNHRGRRV